MKKTILIASLLVACKSSPAAEPATPQPTSMSLVPVSRGLHLRAVFDRDPAVYVGRFAPRDLASAELDENRASKTVCSQHFHAREVAVNQQMDELAWVSSSASAALGFTTGALGGGGSVAASKGKMVRVHYTITKKLQVDSDPGPLAACCEKNPGACTDLVVGEFLMGTGEIYETTSSSTDVSGTVGIPAVAAKASLSDASQWKKAQSFQDTYFAFLPIATGLPDRSGAEAAKSSCDFCSKLPEDATGLYFCGVSPPATDEGTGRDGAMQSARTQVVKYLGEQIKTRTETLSSSARGLVASDTFTTTFAKGVATRVKDQRYCVEKENSPEHRSTIKVLAFVPNDAIDAAAAQAIDEAAHASKVNSSDVDAVKGAVKKAARK